MQRSSSRRECAADDDDDDTSGPKGANWISCAVVSHFLVVVYVLGYFLGRLMSLGRDSEGTVMSIQMRREKKISLPKRALHGVRVSVVTFFLFFCVHARDGYR